MTYLLTAFIVLLTTTGASAGPIDEALGSLVGGAGYWVEAVALVSAMLGLIRALVPASAFPTWLASAVDILASNWGQARNRDPE